MAGNQAFDPIAEQTSRRRSLSIKRATIPAFP
jgi:hypothetical protein